MKKLITILLAVILIAACVITCPDRQDHKDALMSLVNSKLGAELDKATSYSGLAAIGTAVGSKIIEVALDKSFNVKNFFVCSIGLINADDEDKMATFGILGHVFTIGKDKFSQAIDGLGK